jgi:hypothetical protein
MDQPNDQECGGVVAIHQPEHAEIARSRTALETEAEALAQQVLHVSAREALRRVSRGELEGTLFASKLVRLYALMGANDDGTDPQNYPPFCDS